MFKNLSAAPLGISGRQSELIELALTHGFRGLDLDILEMKKRSQVQGVQQAKRFLESAKLRVGGFDLPVRWTADEADYTADLQELPAIAEFAQSIGANACLTNIQPASDHSPYHENFETHRKRLREISTVLEKFQLRLGLGILAAAEHRAGHDFQFIYQPDQLLMLIKTSGAGNIGVIVDTWNWFVGGGTLDQIRKLKAEQIVAVQLANLSPDADLTTVTEQQRLLPGDGGLIDIAGILTHLAEINYDGPLSVSPHADQFKGLKREAIVQRVSTIIDEQWKLAGLNKLGKAAGVGTAG